MAAVPEPTFEILDYTSASNWERFVTAVEEILRTWNVHNGRRCACDLDATSNAPDGNTDDPKTKKEIFSLDESSYALTYHHYHRTPSKHLAQSDGNATNATEDDDATKSRHFLFTDTAAGHPIHRWTGETHVLILAPVSISEIFSSTASSNPSALDLGDSKMLLSSFAVALSNTRCTLPVFIPTGHLWKNLYLGYQLKHFACPPADAAGTPLDYPRPEDGTTGPEAKMGSKYSESNLDTVATALETRFKTALIPYVPASCKHLDGLFELFVDRLGWVARSEESARFEKNVQVTCLFTFELERWFDDDWKTAGEAVKLPGDFSTPPSPLFKKPEDEDVLNDLASVPVHLFATDELPDTSSEEESGPVAPILKYTMPIGPSSDPLKKLKLLTCFPMAPKSTYVDGARQSEMDAWNATQWTLEAQFSIESPKRGQMTQLLADSLDEWLDYAIHEPQPVANGDSPSSQKPSEQVGYLGVGSVLLDAARTRGSNRPVLVDQGDVDSVIANLFDLLKATSNRNKSRRQLRSSAAARKSSKHALTSAASLTTRLRFGHSVPYKSFVWSLVEHVVGILSPTSTYNFSSSSMGFLKGVWAEILKRSQWHWDHLIPLPNIDMYLESEEGEDAANGGGGGDQRTMGIDLRFSLVHQKLVMLNCCIHHKKGNLRNHPSPTLPVSAGSSIGSSVVVPREGHGHEIVNGRRIKKRDVLTRPLRSMISTFAETLDKGGDGLVKLYDKITDESTAGTEGAPRRKSAEPVAPSNARSFCDESQSDEEEFFDSIEDSTSSEARTLPIKHELAAPADLGDISKPNIPFSSIDRSETLQEPSRKGKIITTSHPPDHNNEPSPASFGDSFIPVDYSSSMESAAGGSFGKIPALKSRTSEIEERDEPEVTENDVREGQLHQLDELTLLATNEPLMVPETQDAGYMTEDMLRQQAELFEKLGSSSEAAEVRAQMQSAQLRSDMEAFKAANPQAMIEDFVRWHSPRDWITDAGESANGGYLSARMKEQGNLWNQMWKVLHYLDTLPLDELFEQMLPTVFLVAYDTLVRHRTATRITPVSDSITALSRELVEMNWANASPDGEPMATLLATFQETEGLVGKATSLIRKIPGQSALVNRLLENERVSVKDGKEREAVYDLFSAGAPPQQAFPTPISKEYVFAGDVNAGRDSSEIGDSDSFRKSNASQTSFGSSTHLPHRMYACLREGEFRIVQTETKAT